mmetsp:Transcript_83415/g.179944  ORF Transcript_83415/g.179944 Transcript_83415/m.179944 type:complete len:225 (-) Transcript_83415:908-1582(-)
MLPQQGSLPGQTRGFSRHGASCPGNLYEVKRCWLVKLGTLNSESTSRISSSVVVQLLGVPWSTVRAQRRSLYPRRGGSHAPHDEHHAGCTRAEIVRKVSPRCEPPQGSNMPRDIPEPTCERLRGTSRTRPCHRFGQPCQAAFSGTTSPDITSECSSNVEFLSISAPAMRRLRHRSVQSSPTRSVKSWYLPMALVCATRLAFSTPTRSPMVTRSGSVMEGEAPCG